MVGADVKELSVEERNLLSVAYKNTVGSRRAAWRIISSVEQKEKSKGNDAHAGYAKDYRVKVENELQKICDTILTLLDQGLIPQASHAESKAGSKKMNTCFIPRNNSKMCPIYSSIQHSHMFFNVFFSNSLEVVVFTGDTI